MARVLGLLRLVGGLLLAAFEDSAVGGLLVVVDITSFIALPVICDDSRFNSSSGTGFSGSTEIQQRLGYNSAGILEMLIRLKR